MNEEFWWICNEGRTVKNEKGNDDSGILPAFTVYINQLGQFFSYTYLVTCLNKIHQFSYEHFHKLSTALAIREKVRQELFTVNICQFEGISTAKI